MKASLINKYRIERIAGGGGAIQAGGCVEDLTLLVLPLISGKDDYKPLPEK